MAGLASASLNVLFFGSNAIAIPALRALIASRCATFPPAIARFAWLDPVSDALQGLFGPTPRTHTWNTGINIVFSRLLTRSCF